MQTLKRWPSLIVGLTAVGFGTWLTIAHGFSFQTLPLLGLGSVFSVNGFRFIRNRYSSETGAIKTITPALLLAKVPARVAIATGLAVVAAGLAVSSFAPLLTGTLVITGGFRKLAKQGAK